MTAERGEPWAAVTLAGPAHGFPGRLVAIEGSDGAGKSRFVSWLIDSLPKEVPCTHVLMPGEHLRSYIYWRGRHDESLGMDQSQNDDDGLALMAIGDRLVRQKAIVEPALREGRLVICERFALTPLVFTSDALYRDRLQRLPRPDLGLFFDAPSEVLLERVADRPDGPVHPGSRDDKEREVRRFRLLAESNDYVVVDTTAAGAPDYADIAADVQRVLSKLTAAVTGPHSVGR